MQLSQEEIAGMMALIREGKREGFDLLYANYAAPLYGLLFRMTRDKSVAENLLEVTFVSICNNFHEYNTGTSFCGWLLQTANRVCREHMNKDCGNAMELVLAGGDSAVPANTGNIRTDVRNKLRTYR